MVNMEKSKWSLTTDGSVYFTESLIVNASEDEDIEGLRVNDCKIYSILLMAKQALKFKLILWNTEKFKDKTMNTDSYIYDLDFDLTQRPAFKRSDVYCLNITGDFGGPLFEYSDHDKKKTLHISLMNLSNVSKKAGEEGRVDVKLVMGLEQMDALNICEQTTGMITDNWPHCPACGRAIKTGIVKGTTDCGNCGATVEVTVRAVIEYDTKLV